MLADYLCHALCLLIDLLLLWSIGRSTYTPFTRFLTLAAMGACTVPCLAIILSQQFNGEISLNLALHALAWHGSFFLFASAFLMYRQKRRCFPTLILVIACIYFGLAVDALIVEPQWLIIRKTTITTPKITKPMTIVFCSDIQVDRIGWYERRTLQKIKEQKPDLILFGGDYIHPNVNTDVPQLLHDWNQLFREANLQAPLGIYAIYGNVGIMRDDIFDGTAVILKESTDTQQIGEIRVTFLSIADSWSNQTIPDEERNSQFRIIVGHVPRFAMAEQEADLLLAGHTHGGQV
jgi:predicted phosphodiesterase